MSPAKDEIASEEVQTVSNPVAISGAKRRKPQKTNKVTPQQQIEVRLGKILNIFTLVYLRYFRYSIVLKFKL